MAKEKDILVVVKKAGENGKLQYINNELKTFQSLVDGYIELFYLTSDIMCICNDEGKINGLLPNFGTENDIICGDVVIVASDESGEDFESLNTKQIEQLIKVGLLEP